MLISPVTLRLPMETYHLDPQSFPEPPDEDDDDGQWTVLPAFLQVLAALMFVPMALFCFLGAFGALAMATDAESGTAIAPTLGFFIAFLLLGIWLSRTAFRLLFRRGRPSGRPGPLAWRLGGLLFLALPIAGVFTGHYQEHGVVAIAQAFGYMGVSALLFQKGNKRARMIAAQKAESASPKDL